MSLYITAKRIKGIEMYAVMLGETVLRTACSEQGARAIAAQMLNNIKGV